MFKGMINMEKGLKAAMLLFAVSSGYILVKYIRLNDYASAFNGGLSLLFLLIPAVSNKLLKIKLNPELSLCILFFCFLGFNLGTALQWYSWVPYYDSFIHFLSGILFSMIGYCLFMVIRSDKSVRRQEDRYLQITYALFFSAFIAVMWEIGEFLGFITTGHDAQGTLTTGVFDTMHDFISCLFGSIVAAVDFAIFVKRDKLSPMVKVILAFDRTNLS